jgi:hypothetical protein
LTTITVYGIIVYVNEINEKSKFRRNIKMAKKAKWLEESTTGELLDIIKEGFNSEADDRNIVWNRQPSVVKRGHGSDCSGIVGRKDGRWE